MSGAQGPRVHKHLNSLTVMRNKRSLIERHAQLGRLSGVADSFVAQ
jgi:hypothetical protein